MRTRLSLMLLLAVFTCGLTACGDDDRAPLDGGADDANVTPDGGTDAVVDTEGPRVLRSDPTDEAPGVPTDRTLTIEMSEPVQAGGAVVASSADGTIDVDVTVGDDARFQDALGGTGPRILQERARRRGPLSLLAEGREVVQPQQVAGRGGHRRDV